jgi:hypothetical protein
VNSPSFSHAKSRGRRFDGSFATTKARAKKTLLKISCNPLISLYSGERIQGNPRESNPHNLGFSQRNGTLQENQNRVHERRRARRWERAMSICNRGKVLGAPILARRRTSRNQPSSVGPPSPGGERYSAQPLSSRRATTSITAMPSGESFRHGIAAKRSPPASRK